MEIFNAIVSFGPAEAVEHGYHFVCSAIVRRCDEVGRFRDPCTLALPNSERSYRIAKPISEPLLLAVCGRSCG